MTNNTSMPSPSSEVVSFVFEGHEVRGFQYQGEPHFIGNDVAKALGYTIPKDAVSAHCKALKLLKSGELPLLKIPSRGMNIIPERDVYRLVMRSNLPTAEAFEEKVVGEILPSIRKTGGYMTAAPEETPEEIMLRALTIARETVERQKAENAALHHQNATLAPKAAAHEVLAAIPGELGVTDAGRELKLGRQWVVNTIFARKWACRQGRDIRPAHYGLEMEYCRLVPRPYTDKNTGETKVAEDFKITRKGMGRLAELIAEAKRELDGEARPFARRRTAAA